MGYSDHILKRMRGTGSARQLAALRIGISAQLLYAISSQVFDLFMVVGPSQPVSTIFPEWFDAWTDAWVEPLRWICAIAGALVMIGFATRWVLPVFTVATIVLFGFYYRGANAPVNWLYYWWPLVVLCLAPCAQAWSVDAWLKNRRVGNSASASVPAWPNELMVAWFAYIYFAAGLAKLLPLNKGMAWLNGQTSKEIIYFRYLDSPFHYLFERPFFNYADVVVPFAALTVAALVLELFTGVLLFTRRFHLLVLALVLGMHLFLYLVGVAGFMQTALVLGLALLPAAWFSPSAGRVGSPAQ